MIKRKDIRIYIDLDDTKCHYTKRWKEIREKEGLEYPQSKIGFFVGLDPMQDAIETYNWLDEHFDVWILTAPSIINVHSYNEKREWVEKWLGIERCNRLIISPDKSLFIGDYLIDDTTTKGQLGFQGRHLHFGKEFKDWASIKAFFSKILSNVGEIDLNLYRKGNSTVFSGAEIANEILREVGDIEELFDMERVSFNIPEWVMSINPSFLEKLFNKPVKKLGTHKFLSKLIVNNLSNTNLDDNLGEAINRIEREKHFEIKTKGY